MAADDTFKNSDIYVVDYPSPQTGNIMSVDEEGSNIMNRMTDAKVFGHSEVVFLVHSLGGLVTQRLLLTHRELLPKVKFIYFFSTPDEGAQIAQIGHLFNDDPLLKQMFHGDDNTFLEGIENDWINAKLDMPRYCVRIPGQAEQHPAPKPNTDSGLKPNTFRPTPKCCSLCPRNVFHR
jgi:pimeloyl-ACP methyl ester carboxylesterase